MLWVIAVKRGFPMISSPAPKTTYSVSSRAVPMPPGRLHEAQVMADHPGHVVAEFSGQAVAESRRAVLLLHPDYFAHIFIPFADVRMDLLQEVSGEDMAALPYPAAVGARFWHLLAPDGRREPFGAWGYDFADDGGVPARPELAGRLTFGFHAVDRYLIDGRHERAHVRDPRTVFTVTLLGQNLVARFGDRVVVDSHNALRLTESDYQDRYYVPEADIAMDLLTLSDRVTVCAYKGEARYHHLVVDGQVFENALWGYPEPWTDYADCFASIAGHHGFFTTMLATTLDGRPDVPNEKAAATDSRMRANPNADKLAKARAGVA